MNHAIQATTILCVRRKGKVAIGSDGQVTLGDTVIKQGAKKIRRLYNEKILAGFAGSSADSFALFSRFEAKLEQFHGNLSRAAVELAKDWRIDRSLRCEVRDVRRRQPSGGLRCGPPAFRHRGERQPHRQNVAAVVSVAVSLDPPSPPSDEGMARRSGSVGPSSS